MTWRELGVYVKRLPADSATRIAMNEGKPEPTQETILLADVFDMLQHVRWQIAAHGVEKESQLPKRPTPYPRWWDPERSKRGRKDSPERAARIKEGRRRAAERRRQIAAGQIT